MSKLRHVRRQSLPWRPDEDRTECGRSGAGLELMSRAEWRLIAREWNQLCASWHRAGVASPPGVQRPNICQTCWDTAARWPTWEDHPARALEREIEMATRGRPWRATDKLGSLDQLGIELMALGVLYRRDPDGFARLLVELPEAIRRRGGVAR